MSYGIIEHGPSRGNDYESGIDGERIAIVGYSHHHDPGKPDRDSLTMEVISEVISGEKKGYAFFSRVSEYFDSDAAFWNRVLFFNFLPDCIGVTAQRYGTGSQIQIERGQERFLRIIREQRPHKVFVFTMKGWRAIQEKTGEATASLGESFPRFSWDSYTAADWAFMAFGLRHPQFARAELMQRAVRRILAIRSL